MGERPTPDAPHPGKRRPRRARSCRPHSGQSQHARVRAVGLVTGHHVCDHRTHSQWVVGPGRAPARTYGCWWGSARPRTPHTQAEGALPGTLMLPPQRAKPACKRARCGVGDGSPRPHFPHPRPVGTGPQPQARKDEWSGVGERPSRDAPHQGKRRPPRATSCRPHSAQSQLVRARAAGLVTGPHARTPSTYSQWVVGSAARPNRREVGGGRAPDPGRPTPRQEVPSPGALMPPPQRAKLARQSARCGVCDGSPRPHPPHLQPVGSGPRPNARTDVGRGGESTRPRTLRGPGKRRPRRAPSCRPHSAQSEHARVRAVGLVMGPRARTPRTHSQWLVGPGRMPERTIGRGWESARPRTPETQAKGAPPGHPHAAPTARKATSQERALRAG